MSFMNMHAVEMHWTSLIFYSKVSMEQVSLRQTHGLIIREYLLSLLSLLFILLSVLSIYMSMHTYFWSIFTYTNSQDDTIVQAKSYCFLGFWKSRCLYACASPLEKKTWSFLLLVNAEEWQNTINLSDMFFQRGKKKKKKTSFGMD